MASQPVVTLEQAFQIALQHLQTGQRPQAEHVYRQMVLSQPANADGLHLLGVLALHMGLQQETEEHLRRALALDANHLLALNTLGSFLHTQKRMDEASECFERALALKNDFVEAIHNLGNARLGQNRVDDAVTQFRQALTVRPQYPSAHTNLALALQTQGKTEEALDHFRQAIALRPDYYEARYNMGVVLMQFARHEEALQAFQEALRLRPNDPRLHANLGDVYLHLGDGEKARIHLEESLRLNPQLGDTHRLMGDWLYSQARDEEALTSYDQALRLGSQHTELRPNRARVFLRLDNCAIGWPEYEFRTTKKTRTKPEWDGGDLTGKTILLHAEGGLSDTLMFCRFTSAVKARGGKVLLEVPRSLVPLLRRLKGIDGLVPAGSATPAHDVQMALPSLARYIPLAEAPVPYLRPDPKLVATWTESLKKFRGFKIGVAWQGNADSRSERQRAVPLAQFEPLAKLPGVKLLHLQKQHGLDQVARADERVPLANLGAFDTSNGQFMDTAAMLKQLDLVIASDGPMVHLAGGLGAKVWMPTAFSPDWRWLLKRDDSPWYPSLRLFRQTQTGRWEDVVERMADEVRKLL